MSPGRAPDSGDRPPDPGREALGLPERRPPPVELWDPPGCGDIGLKIDRDGVWHYRETPIRRPALARLFSTILRRDPDGYVLVTPVEKVRVEVEDAPFLAVEMERAHGPNGPILRFRTSVGDWTEAGPDRPIRFELDARGGVKPYVKVRGELWAKLARSLLPELVEFGEIRETEEGRTFGVASQGAFFAMAPAQEVEFHRMNIDRMNSQRAEAPRAPFDYGDLRLRARRSLAQSAPDAAWLADAAPGGDFALSGREIPAQVLASARPAAVLVPIVARDQPMILLTERASGLNKHSGQIAFPGGKIDGPGETPLAAALREAQEEIGLDPGRVEPLGYLDPYFTGSGYRIAPVVALIAPPFDLALNSEEVAEAFEVPLDFLMRPANHQHVTRERDGRRYYAMPFENRYIWGATAGMLRKLYEKLYG